MNKIPVYYHIPKCGGTYISSLYEDLNVKLARKETNKFKQFNNKICRKAIVHIQKNRFIVIYCIVQIQDLLKINCDIDSYYNNFSIEELLNLLDQNKIKITSIFIKPTGDGNLLHSRREVDKLLKYIKKEAVYFTIVRDIFDRLYSEYSYLINSMSNHETTHEYYRSYHDFEQFLIQSNGYNNQISRQIAYNIPLDNNSFENVKRFFDDFTIADMQNIKETAIKVWEKCYGWSDGCDNDNLFYRNKNTDKKNLLIENISTEAREQFLIKTKWDRKLYAYLSEM